MNSMLPAILLFAATYVLMLVPVTGLDCLGCVSYGVAAD